MPTLDEALAIFDGKFREMDERDRRRQRTPHEDRQRMLNQVLDRCKRPKDGCWTWQGATGANGYGRVKVARKLYLPHRVVAYAMGIVSSLDDPERRECVLHSCDNVKCCNPAHLSKGTLSENMKDCAKKRRLYIQSDKGRRAMSERKRKLIQPSQS